MNSGEKVRAFILMAVLLIILVYGMFSDPITKKDNMALRESKEYVMNTHTPHRPY